MPASTGVRYRRRLTADEVVPGLSTARDRTYESDWEHVLAVYNRTTR